jgi:hypothetical protein
VLSALTPATCGIQHDRVNAGPIPDLLTFILLTWLIGLAAVIVYEFVRGRIWFRGLFTTDVDGDGIADEFHPERVQLLIMSLCGIVGYAVMTMEAASASNATLTVLPDIPEELLMILGASNTFYLSGKYGRTLQRG